MREQQHEERLQGGSALSRGGLLGQPEGEGSAQSVRLKGLRCWLAACRAPRFRNGGWGRDEMRARWESGEMGCPGAVWVSQDGKGH